MAGGEVADVQRDPGERLDLHRLPLREEPIGDAALIEHLDGARVQTAGARAVELLARAPLDDCDIDPRQRQLSPPASSPSDRLRRSPPHARSYATPPLSVGSGSDRRFCAPTRALLQAPGARYIENGREWISLFPLFGADGQAFAKRLRGAYGGPWARPGRSPVGPRMERLRCPLTPYMKGRGRTRRACL